MEGLWCERVRLFKDLGVQGLGFGCARVIMVQGLGCSKPRCANPPQQGHASDKFVFLCHAVLKKSFFYDNPLH